MSVSPAPVYMRLTSVQAASTKIYHLAFSMTSTNGRPNLVTASTKPKSSLQTTESGKPGHRVSVLSLLPTLSIIPSPVSCSEDRVCLGT